MQFWERECCFFLYFSLFCQPDGGQQVRKIWIILLSWARRFQKTEPSAVLQYRLDRAADYLEQNPDTVCIVSGAQGRNEPCTEAEGMADYLLAKGIPAERILQEREAHTTAENLAYSRKLMPEGSSVGSLPTIFMYSAHCRSPGSRELKTPSGLRRAQSRSIS